MRNIDFLQWIWGGYNFIFSIPYSGGEAMRERRYVLHMVCAIDKVVAVSYSIPRLRRKETGELIVNGITHWGPRGQRFINNTLIYCGQHIIRGIMLHRGVLPP